MFEIKVDGVDALLKKLDTFGKQVEALRESMPQELLDWQREDMRRKFPNIKVDSSGNQTAASTEIWPHSRLETQEEQARRQGLGPKQRGPARAVPKQHRVVHAAPKLHRGPVPRSTRPILRQELEQKLHDRMIRLATEAMKWP
jgi:hypothetical protein